MLNANAVNPGMKSKGKPPSPLSVYKFTVDHWKVLILRQKRTGRPDTNESISEHVLGLRKRGNGVDKGARTDTWQM